MMSKSEMIQKIADDLSLSKKDVKAVIESLASVGYKELKKTGEFLLPGFAKFVVVKKPATKERKGINPFTKEPTVFKAKPARKSSEGSPGEGRQGRRLTPSLLSEPGLKGRQQLPHRGSTRRHVRERADNEWGLGYFAYCGTDTAPAPLQSP